MPSLVINPREESVISMIKHKPTVLIVLSPDRYLTRLNMVGVSESALERFAW